MKKAKRSWIFILFSILLCGQISAQSFKTKEKSPRFSVLELSYGFGGIWYLNEIDNIPKVSVSVGHGWHEDYFDISIHSGFEVLEDVFFVPVFFQLSRPLPQSHFDIRFGYVFADSRLEFQQGNFEYFGGFGGGLGYGYSLYQNENLTTGLKLSYQFRQTHLEFEVGHDEIESNQYYHHLVISAEMRF